MPDHDETPPRPLGASPKDPLSFLTGGSDDPRVQGAAHLQRRGWGAAGFVLIAIVVAAVIWALVEPLVSGVDEPVSSSIAPSS